MSEEIFILEDLIRKKQITFYSYGKKIKTDLKDFGQYNWDLVTHIVEQSGDKILIAGGGLEKYLHHLPHMSVLVDFAMQLWSKRTEKYPRDKAIGVAVDIDALNPIYLAQRNPEEEKIFNGLGQMVSETSSWLPEMPYVEKVWNFALCNAMGGLVGSPGYEYPREEASFLIEAVHLAQHFVIGTPKQVRRYEKYALDHLQAALSQAKRLEENPGLIFENPYDLLQLERVVGNARRIAENVVHFGM